MTAPAHASPSPSRPPTTALGPALSRYARAAGAFAGRLVRQRAFWILVGAFLCEKALEGMGALQPLDNYVFDTMFWIEPTDTSERIVLVEIDDADYENVFDSKSPLMAEKLFAAIERIARARPRVIGVDIDTSDSSFGNGGASLRDAPIVWARGKANPEPNSIDQSGDDAIVCEPFLGGQFTVDKEKDRLDTTPASGIALVCVDRDGVVRHYLRSYRVVDPAARAAPPAERPVPGLLESFPWKIVSMSCEHDDEEGAKAGKETEPVKIRFCYGGKQYQKIRFSTLLHEGTAETWEAVLRDKIVLVGGTYKAARELHVTPVGQRYGMELLADIVDTECNHQTIIGAGPSALLALHFLPSLLILALHHYWPGPSGVLLSIPIVFLAIPVTYFLFHTLSYFLNFLLVPVSIWVHTLVEEIRMSQGGQGSH